MATKLSTEAEKVAQNACEPVTSKCDVCSPLRVLGLHRSEARSKFRQFPGRLSNAAGLIWPLNNVQTLQAALKI